MRKSTEYGASKTIIPLALAYAITLILVGISSAQETDPQIGPPFPIPPGQADKIVASSSSLEVLEGRLTEEGTDSVPVELLRTSFDRRARNATDLIIRVDGECAAVVNEAEEEGEEPPPEEPTQDISVADTTTQAKSVAVTAWLELDGAPVSVSGITEGDIEVADDGTVVFCNSSEKSDFSDMEADDAIETFAELRKTGGFTWTVPDVDSGFHELVLLASLDLSAEEGEDDGGEEPPIEPAQDEDEGDDVDALGFVGKRILIVDFAKASFEESGEI